MVETRNKIALIEYTLHCVATSPRGIVRPHRLPSESVHRRGKTGAGTIMTVDVTQTQSKSDNLVARRNALPLPVWSRSGKRAFDIIIAFPSLLLLSPLFGIITLAIRLNSP